MKRVSWLMGWWQRKQSAQRRKIVVGGNVAGQAETFETRQLLSVSALFIPATGELNIQLDNDDSVRLSATTAGNVLLEAASGGGAFTPINSIGTVAASSVQSIIILGGDEANTIDLNGVTLAAFTATPTIEVDGANGHDTLMAVPIWRTA